MPELAAWETSAAAPFITMLRPRGLVEVWALGRQRFKLISRGHEQVVVGYAEAERVAEELAEQLE
jgi:hypothetical protein